MYMQHDKEYLLYSKIEKSGYVLAENYKLMHIKIIMD